LNIASIKNTLRNLPDGSAVCINTERSKSLDFDIRELLLDFTEVTSKSRNIQVRWVGDQFKKQ